jgi:uncharacterized membrane protein
MAEETTIQMNPETKKGQNTLMAILSYVGPLIIVSYIMGKDDPFVKFHIKQGAVLFVVEVAMWFLVSMMIMLWPLWQLVNLAVFVMAIIGIINAAQGKEKELPFIGKFGHQFPL